MISNRREVKKQKEDETNKSARTRFKRGTSRFPAEIEFLFPARPLDFTPRVRRERKEKTNSTLVTLGTQFTINSIPYWLQNNCRQKHATLRSVSARTVIRSTREIPNLPIIINLACFVF